MEDSSYVKAKETAVGLAKLLVDHKGGAALAMDLSGLNAWTDFFVIATVTSSTHLQGLHKHVKEYAAVNGVDIFRMQRRIASDDEWSLIDLGNVVVHLMTAKARGFYDLERLWSDAGIVWRAES